MRVAIVALLFAACGGDATDDCACTVSTGGQTVNLACGGTACVGGYEYGCAEDNVQLINPCGPDLSVVGPPPVCYELGQTCTPGQSTCCTSDGGLAPVCDTADSICCLETGAPCQRSDQCCGGVACVVLNGAQVCGS